MATQTAVLEKLAQLPIPPCVRETVPISVPPTEISSVMLVAEAAGTITNVAAMANAKSKSLPLLLRTTVPPFGEATLTTEKAGPQTLRNITKTSTGAQYCRYRM
jgi:hypothetical protein